MRVLRVAVVIGKMDSGGKKNLVMEYYRHIDKSKVQFDFICDQDSQAIPTEEIESMGGRVFLVPPYQHPFGYMIQLFRLCRKNRYQVIHAYNSTMNVFPMCIAKLAGIPVRISESLSMAHEGDWRTILKKMLLPFSRRFATHYMACGEDCGRWQFGNKMFHSGRVAVFKTVINTAANAYDPDLRAKTRKAYGLDQYIVLGHIGRFVPQKNPLFLLDICNEIFQMEKDARLLLIGDGELKSAMMDKIEKLGIRDKVIYLGRREDIGQFYNAMDAFLLPSLYEGLPVVGLEAQSAGLPIFFSSEVTREVRASALGHFLELDRSAKEWAEAILNAIRANREIRRSWSKEVAEAGFDSASEAMRLQKYYFNAVRESGANGRRRKKKR